MGSFDERIKQTVEILRNADNVVAFTGAGISTESGVSDFRSPGGVWERYRMVGWLPGTIGQCLLFRYSIKERSQY